ncbi:MAG: hypothetical protein ACYCZQ_15810 [Burkholderiales bacterium]
MPAASSNRLAVLMRIGGMVEQLPLALDDLGGMHSFVRQHAGQR